LNYRLPLSGDKAHYVRTRFDAIARRYNLYNDLITQGQHRLWKRVLVKNIPVRPHSRGLDICCGTGDIAKRCYKRLSPGDTQISLDFSPNMLRIARQRFPAANGEAAPASHVLCGDAMRLPFADGSFHYITVGFGLRNVSDLAACLKEILRVLAPGGVFASLDVGKVHTRGFRQLADFYFFKIVPFIGTLLQPGEEMYHYLPHSSVNYPSQDEMKILLEDTGFRQVRLKEFLCGTAVLHTGQKPA